MEKNQKKKPTNTFTTFEDTLIELNDECKKGPVSIKKILMKLSGKGKSLLIIFFCLPFGLILGLAIPFGLYIAFLGFRMAFSKNSIWLPNWLLRKKINGKFLRKIIHQIIYPLKKMKPLTHPRYIGFLEGKHMRIINGCVIGLVGFFLAISLPIPLSSFIAFAAIFLLGLGILNEDGILVAISYPIALIYIVFVIVTLDYVPMKEIYQWLESFL